VIRHGETEWSLSGQHTSRTDIPLTPNGEAGARRLAPWLSRVHFDRVFTSPRQRARRTCELAGLAARAEVEPDLAEWDYGDYEGIRSSEIHVTRPDWNLFDDGCPNGEMPDEVAARADRLIDRLTVQGGTCALFCHGHIGAVLAAGWIMLPPVNGECFPLAPAALSILGHHGKTRVISSWNVDLAAYPD